MAIFAYFITLSYQIHSKNINTFEFIIQYTTYTKIKLDYLETKFHHKGTRNKKKLVCNSVI